MGLEYRGAENQRRVRAGKRTIKDGEGAIVWNRQGVVTEHIGPQLIYLFYSTIRFMDRIIARANEYLVVESLQGEITHVKGPIGMFCNPTKHRGIVKAPAIEISTAKECIVVTNLKDGVKQAVKGPTLFFPTPNDRIYTFKGLTQVHNLGTIDNPMLFSGEPSKQEFQVIRHEDFVFCSRVYLVELKHYITVSITLDFHDINLVSEILDFFNMDFSNILKNDLLGIQPGLGKQVTLEFFQHELMPEFEPLEKGGKMKFNKNFPGMIQLFKQKNMELKKISIVSLVATLDYENKKKQAVEAEEKTKLQQRIADIELENEEKRSERIHKFKELEQQRKMELLLQEKNQKRDLKKKDFDDFFLVLSTLQDKFSVNTENLLTEIVTSKKTSVFDLLGEKIKSFVNEEEEKND